VQFDGQSAGDDYIKLWTHDPEVARRFGMEGWEAKSMVMAACSCNMPNRSGFSGRNQRFVLT